MSGYYDRDGRAITIDRFVTLHRGDYKIVARTELPGSDVSTVWLGADHQFGDGPPLIFETMILGGGLDQYQRRYSTEDRALAGHEDAVRLVKAELVAFEALCDDVDVRRAVELLEGKLDAHAREFWGETGLHNGEAYARLAKAVAPW